MGAGAQRNLRFPDLGLSRCSDRRPLLERLQRLTARVDDTVAALCSDVMDVALEGYSLVKVSGRAQGLDELRRELGSRFAKTRRKEPTPA